MSKKWRQVPGYGYDVSRDGRIRNRCTGRELKPSWLKAGSKRNSQYRYRVAFGGRNWMLHTLVYRVWNDIPLDKTMRVYFVDGDARNCSVDNLSPVKVNHDPMVPLPQEKWESIPGIPDFFVSSLARIAREIDGMVYLVEQKTYYTGPNGRGPFLAFYVHRSYVNRSWYSVKAAVAAAFCGDEWANKRIHHIDGDYTNCLPDNLAIIRQEYSIPEVIRAVLRSRHVTADERKAVLALMIEGNATMLDAYIVSKYKKMLSYARRQANRMYLPRDFGDDALHNALVDIKGIVAGGGYRGLASLYGFVCGVIKKRLCRLRREENKTISAYGHNANGKDFFLPDMYPGPKFFPNGSFWSAHID